MKAVGVPPVQDATRAMVTARRADLDGGCLCVRSAFGGGYREEGVDTGRRDA
jgi:hypothetical protein